MAFITSLPQVLSTTRDTARRCMQPHRAVKKRSMRCTAHAQQEPHPSQRSNEDELPLELVEGYVDNAKVRPKIDIDADEYMLMWKLRKMLHEDDFNKIFDSKSRKIGEL